MNNKYIVLENRLEPVMEKRERPYFVNDTVDYRYLYCRNCTREPVNMVIRINRLDETIYDGRVTCPNCGRMIDFSSSGKKAFLNTYGESWNRAFLY